MVRTAPTALKHRRRERRRYWDRLAAGFCGRCGKVRVPVGVMVCPTCRARDEEHRLVHGRDRDNDRRRQVRKMRAGRGLCPNCAEPSSPGLKLCDRCREKGRTYYHTVTAPVRARIGPTGLCSARCGSDPDPGYRTCTRCRARSKDYYYARGRELRRQRRMHA